MKVSQSADALIEREVRRMTRVLLILLAVLGLVPGIPWLATSQSEAPRSPTPAPVSAPVRVQIVARGLDHPWGLTFLPDGRMLVTERSGQLRLVGPDGRISEPLAGLPQVAARGQGGRRVALDPRFAERASSTCPTRNQGQMARPARPWRGAGSARAGSRTSG
jgi:glucose/arabinose dehydrogenase